MSRYYRYIKLKILESCNKDRLVNELIKNYWGNNDRELKKFLLEEYFNRKHVQGIFQHDNGQLHFEVHDSQFNENNKIYLHLGFNLITKYFEFVNFEGYFE